MKVLAVFLSNPIVGSIGYVLSLVASIIAIGQFIEKTKALSVIEELNIKFNSVSEENNNLKLKIYNTNNNNDVSQGDKSQYFQDNSGPVSIDNRG